MADTQKKDAEYVSDLMMLVGRLVRQVRRFDADNDVAEKAMDYLRRHDLDPFILRGVIEKQRRKAGTPTTEQEMGGDQIDVEFAEGIIWTVRCSSCGFENGEFIECGKMTKARENADPYSTINRPCVNCGFRPVKWVRIGKLP